jgi:epoxyqueuosine reductase
MGNWVFGCDDCQSVCPYNQDAPVTAIRDFQPRDGLDAPALIDLLEMDEEMFRKRFEGTPILRARWAGLVRNAAVALGNSGDARAIEPLGQALQHPEAIVRGHAAWALGNLGGPRSEDLLEKHMKLEKDPEAFEEITAAIQQVRELKAFL